MSCTGHYKQQDMEDSKQVLELTEELINFHSNDLTFSPDNNAHFKSGAIWAKSRSDEYCKQEIAKKVQEIERLRVYNTRVIRFYSEVFRKYSTAKSQHKYLVGSFVKLHSESKEKDLRIAELERKLEEMKEKENSAFHDGLKAGFDHYKEP